MKLHEYLWHVRQPYANDFGLGLWLGNAIASSTVAKVIEPWEVAYINNIVMARLRGVKA